MCVITIIPLHSTALTQQSLMNQRALLSKAITLVESTRPQDIKRAQSLISKLLNSTIGTIGTTGGTDGLRSGLRVGVSGPPGAGKSTFIDALGLSILTMPANHSASTTSTETHQTSQQTQCSNNGNGNDNNGNGGLAVLAVDPSSALTGGSILGDKTRMYRLSTHPRCFIRPTATCGHLGGIAKSTRDSILLCQGMSSALTDTRYIADCFQLSSAHGYDTVIVESVGVGQSEFELRNIVDVFVLLVPPGSGDELQGIKRGNNLAEFKKGTLLTDQSGIMELADVLVVNKVDGDLKPAAMASVAEYTSALKLLKKSHTPVVPVSSKTGYNIDLCWSTILNFIAKSKESGEFSRRRKEQSRKWLLDHVKDELVQRYFVKESYFRVENSEEIGKLVVQCENQIECGELNLIEAVDKILDRFIQSNRIKS